MSKIIENTGKLKSIENKFYNFHFSVISVIKKVFFFYFFVKKKY